MKQKKTKLRTVRCRKCGARISCWPGNTTKVLTDHYREAHGTKPPRF